MRTNENIEIDRVYKSMQGRNIKKYEKKDILQLVEWMQDIPAELRQNEIDKIAFIWICGLSHFDDWKTIQSDEEFCKQCCFAIELIAVTEQNNKYQDAYVECIRFLYDLNSNITQTVPANITKKYWDFQDIVPMIKGLFLLQNNDGTRLFPVHELLLGMTKNFQCDNNHLVNLALALEMFDKIKDYADIMGRDEVYDELIQIAKEHNIQFLEWIVDGGTLRMDELDYQKNGTLIVINKKEDEAIIRNIRKNYFHSYPEEKIEPEDEELAWFVKISINQNEELTDIQTILKADLQEVKIKLLEVIEEQNIFNVFLKDRIVVDKHNHQFIRFLNVFSAEDEVIVCNENCEESSREGFLKTLRSKRNRLRGCWLCKNRCDILTVDFYAAFYLEVVRNAWKFCVDLEEEKKDFYQGSLIHHFIKEYLLMLPYEKKYQVIGDLYSFYNNYFDFSSFDETKFMDGNLLAFPFIENNDEIMTEKTFLMILKEQLFEEDFEDWVWEDLRYNTKSRRWSLYEKSLDNYRLKSWDGEEIESPIGFLPKNDCRVFYNKVRNEIIYDKEVTECIKRWNKLLELSEWQIIHFDFKSVYLCDKLEKVMDLMDANQLDYSVFEVFQCDNAQKRIVLLYKILWHFQIYRIDEHKVDEFWKLMLEKHYTGCVENKEAIKKYFEEMKEYAEGEGTLVLAKESSGNESTLQYLFDIFERPFCRRSRLSWAFDAGTINMHLEFNKQENKSYWCGKRLKKIIFMVDNLMFGESLEKLLNFQVNGEDCNNRNYLRTVPPISEILGYDSSIKVEIHIIFGLPNCKETFQKKYNVDIVIHELIQEKYISDEESIRIVADLYAGHKAELGVCCIFRYCNLPSKSILPKATRNPKKVVGLFQRINESR